MRTVLGVVANASHVLAVQVLALVTLDPSSYGAFSLQYLVFALGSSLSLSVVSEAWLREGLSRSSWAPWRDYGNATLALAGAMVVLSLLVSLAMSTTIAIALAGAIAVSSSVYRVSARYYAVREGSGVVLGDLCGLFGTGFVWTWFVSGGDRSLLAMTVAWAAGAALAAVASRWPPRPSLTDLKDWFRSKRGHITLLLRDSLLMDAGAIGTPYALAPLLGVAQFGVYRAVSNVAAPVRLLLAPIRPKIATLASSPPSWRRDLAVLFVSAGLGTCAFLALVSLSAVPFDLGALEELEAFALPTAVFVAVNFLGSFYYILARAGLTGSGLLVGRLIQTASAVAGPLGGFAIGGLGTAIWGLAIATVASALAWIVLVRRNWRVLI